METANGLDPAFEIAPKDNEETQWGRTITNNEYIAGSIALESDEMVLPPSEMRIRVRGNTSASTHGRVPYKIELESKQNLLGLDGDYAEKEWLLLNCGESLNLYLGLLLSDACGLEWRPQMRFVNVMLNGDWKGLYILTEPVRRIVTQLPISDSGYLFENDIYWYNTDGLYFTTGLQPAQYGFTFKYPKIREIGDARIAVLAEYMQNLEVLMENDTGAVFDYVDEDSFAAWTLVKDISNILDPNGSNMFFYLQSLDPDDPTASQLKLGPVWDFDAAFGLYHIDASSEFWGPLKDLTEGWSWQHSWPGTYTNYLMQNPYFYSRYTALWHTVRTNLLQKLSDQLDELQGTQGEALNESRSLNAARWHIKTILLEDEIAYDKVWLADRIAWIDSQLGTGA